jgi:hypothetical protein
MHKRQFTPAERYAVFTVHGEKCYLCHAPVTLRTMEIDHVIPETLRDEPARLAAVLVALGRSPDFDINSFANWLPSCGPCNNMKRDYVFEPSGQIQIILQRAEAKVKEAQRLAAQIISERRVAYAVNVLAQANESGELPEWVRDSLKPLIVFHIEHREPELAAQPIRLAPNCEWALEIEFNGGPLKNKTIVSGSPELDATKSWWFLKLVGGFIGQMEQKNTKPSSYLTWKQPCKDVVELADEQGWSPEEREQRMKHHIYEVKEYEDLNMTLRLKAYYQGIG